jgi:uncharacterized linocin/CFP29 family protein
VPGPPVGANEDVKPKTEQEDVKPVLNEAEVAEQRAREIDARITAELPELKVAFGRSRWELDVSVSWYKK